MNSEIKKIKSYCEASGIYSYYTHSKNSLNEYGEYEENIDDFSLANGLSPNYTDSTNESLVAQELYSDVEEIQYDSRIGYYKSLYIGHVLEENYRKNASSGGIGTWIFKELFEKI